MPSSKLTGSWNCCGRCGLSVGLLAREGSGGKGSSGDGARPGVVEGWVCCRRGASCVSRGRNVFLAQEASRAVTMGWGQRSSLGLGLETGAGLRVTLGWGRAGPGAGGSCRRPSGRQGSRHVQVGCLWSGVWWMPPPSMPCSAFVTAESMLGVVPPSRSGCFIRHDVLEAHPCGSGCQNFLPFHRVAGPPFAYPSSVRGHLFPPLAAEPCLVNLCSSPCCPSFWLHIHWIIQWIIQRFCF